MKEVWDLAISGQVLPFTLLLVPIGLYWLLALLGTVDLDFLHLDLDSHVETDVDVDLDADMDVDAGAHGEAGGGPGPLLGTVHGALKLVNATDVPLMIVLSVLMLMMWLCAMLGNLWFNESGGDSRGTIIAIASVLGGLVLTRLITEPLKPVFRVMKGEGTPNRPVVGRSGTVRTGQITDKIGQVEIREGGEVLLLTARLAEGALPLERGTEVIVYDYDQAAGIYYVRGLSTT